MPKDSKSLAFYALALQLKCHAVNQSGSREASEKLMQESIATVDNAIAGAIGFHGKVDLVVVPEYFMTSHPAGESLQEWRDLAAIDLQGRQIELLSIVAQKHRVYLAGNAYEADPNFESIYFQTSFILAPNGDLILKYRRLISMYTPSPIDVLDPYLDLYGKESLLPVVSTPIGRMAAIASEEVLYPEIARCLAMRGAELFVHSSSEAGLRGLSPKNLAKRARAMENMAYLVSANSAGIVGGPMLEDSTDTGSQIVNHHGEVLSEADSGESMNVVREIDINAVRRARQRVGMSNFLARQPMSFYTSIFNELASPLAENSFMSDEGAVETPERSFFKERQQSAIEHLSRKGII